jgi:hypothetical protein
MLKYMDFLRLHLEERQFELPNVWNALREEEDELLRKLMF